jgi:dTDP-4-amino-4,6-dideoxygalactose transaminase
LSGVPPVRIPFNRPSVEGAELELLASAVANGHISGDGPYTREASRILETTLGAPAVLLTTSCTDALEMAAILADIKPGDEVIVPAFTFVSSVNAFVLRGARPVFADIRADTLNIDESRLESLITARTRVIVVVHYAGVGCEMEAILELARSRGILVVEDNAHGLFGRHRGRMLGTFAPLATQSFHETKNVNCGEGGALVINDSQYLERAEIIREKGTDRSRFFRGLVDKYTWVDIGSSYLLSDLLAAYLVGQLRCRTAIQDARRRIWDYYDQTLGGWAARNGVMLPFVPDHCDQPYHMFYLLLPSLEDRQSLLAHLRHQGIVAAFHYLPLNASPMAQRFSIDPHGCPVSKDISDRLLRLPFFNTLTVEDQATVVESIHSWHPRRK